MPLAAALLPPALARRRTALDDLVHELTLRFGPACRAVVAHGAAVAGHPSAAIETAVVVADDDLAALRSLARHGGRFARAGLAAPLVLTLAQLARTRDSFPLELLDLAQCHVVLHGEPPFADLVLAHGDVRLQCERELNAVQIALRRRLLAAAGDEAALDLADLTAQLVRVARGLLLLRGVTAPATAPAVFAAATAALGLRFDAALAAWRGATGWDAFSALYAEVAGRWSAVDAW